MSNCGVCWKKRREKRRSKLWHAQDSPGPSMRSAVHALMQNVNISNELKAKATFASAVLAMTHRTPGWQSEVSAHEVITDTVRAPENTEADKRASEIKKASYPLNDETATADKTRTPANVTTADTMVTNTVISRRADVTSNSTKTHDAASVPALKDETATADKTRTPANVTTVDTMVTDTEISRRADVTSNSTETVGDAVNVESESCRCPKLIYYRLMLPNWLRQNATWGSTYEGDDLNLEIKSDSSDWENILRVPIFPACQFDDCDDITVKMNVGVLLPEEAQPCHNNMSYMISDGHFAMGIMLNDPQQDYATCGPYEAVEGDVGSKTLRNPNTKVAATVCTTTCKKNPDQFELRFKPSEAWGSAYCAVDNGHKIVAQYSDSLKLSKGLRFEMYRHKSKERYTTNYVEFSVYQDSPAALLPVLQRCRRETLC